MHFESKPFLTSTSSTLSLPPSLSLSLFGEGKKKKQRASSSNVDLSVAVLEKGAAIGAHTLSGAAVDPRSLVELLGEDWATADAEARAASGVAVAVDRFFYLSEKSAWRLPTPPQMNNKKCKGRVLSLGELVRYLGRRAEEAGVDVFPGFAASALLLEENRSDATRAVAGVVTGDVGVARDGVSHRRGGFSRGVEVRARATLLAEGARGSLTQQAEREFGLREQGGGAGGAGGGGGGGAEPQTYALGLKEVWSVLPEKHSPGTAWHTVGFPLPSDTYGGGFLYHLGSEEEQGQEQEEEEDGEASGSGSGSESESEQGEPGGGDAGAPAAADDDAGKAPPPSSTAKPCRVSLGLVVGLDYKDPTLNPYQASCSSVLKRRARARERERKKNKTQKKKKKTPQNLTLPPSFFFPRRRKNKTPSHAQEFQRFKSHPKIRELLEGGTCRSYGARTLNEGGWQSLPRLDFPGGALLGCAAGTLVVPRIKGVHTAIASGMQAADVAFAALQRDDELAREAEERRQRRAAEKKTGEEEEFSSGDEEEEEEEEEQQDDVSKPYVRPALDLSDYDRVLRESWVGRELEEARNIRPG